MKKIILDTDLGSDCDDEGCVVIESDGKDCYLIANATEEEICKEIDEYMN